MEILVLFCPAIFSLGIFETFVTDVKEKGTWFKIKYVAIMSLAINFVSCLVIWKIKGEGFYFFFEQYTPMSWVSICGVYVAVSLLITLLLIVMHNFFAIKIERREADDKVKK